MNLQGSGTYCPGSFATIDAGVWSDYLWSTGDTGQSIDVSTEGLVSVTVTDNNGCTGEASIDISEQLNLTPTIIGELSFCEGESTQLNAGNGFDDYLWSDGSTDQFLTVNQNGTYSVTVSDNSGCSGTDEVDVMELATPVS